jgi:hypothetical protein
MSSRFLAAAAALAAVLLMPAQSLSGQRTAAFGSFNATTSVAFSIASTRSERSAAIAWRCMPDGLNVIYLIGDNVGKEMDTDVVIRSVTDERAPQTMAWTLLEGHRAAFLPRQSVETFTADAIVSQKLALSAIDPQGRTFSDEFQLDGLRGALQYILPCQY